MANGLFSSMLGFNPVDLQQKRMQQFLAPIQQAQNPYEKIGAALGTIGGGALFGIEDPQLQRASKIRGIMDSSLENVDMTDPTAYKTSLLTLAQNLKDAGETDAALYAINEAAKIKPSERKTVTLSPNQQLVDPATQEVLYTAPPAPDKPESFKPSTAFGEVGQELGFGAKTNLNEYTPAQAAAINKEIQKRKENEQKASVPLAGRVDIASLAKAQDVVDQYTKGPSDKLSNIAPLRTQLNEAKAGSGAAFEQVRGQLIKLVGDTQISNAERSRITGSSGVLEDAVNKINTLLTGTPTQDKLNEIERIVVALEDVYADQFNRGANKAKTVLDQAKFSPETRAALLPSRYVSAAEKARAAKVKPPDVGIIQNGFRFKGGNPADKNNWEKVQ